jgi:hypothetical protein
MPSPKNRKKPTEQPDVPGDRPLTSRRLTIAFVAGLLAGLAVATWSAPGVAGDSPWQAQGAEAARSGSEPRSLKLKWLPYRPSGPRTDGPAEAPQRGPRTTSQPSVRTAQRPQGKAFQDPFADAGGDHPMPTLAGVPGGKGLSEKPAPDNRSDGIPLEEPSAQPTPGDSRPEFPAEKPLAAPPETDLERLPLPTRERPLGKEEVEAVEECPSPYDPGYYTKISELSSDITAEDGDFPKECTLTAETFQPFAAGEVRRNGLGEPWSPTTFTWKASALCHKPLYFEDVHLERYGHSWGPRLQPILSGAHFFLTVPALPYMMGLYPPCECIYTLGYYRPGSCAPYMLDPLPLSIRAGLAEGGVWTGMAFLIP